MSDNDKYAWLEEVQGEKALDWVRARNQESSFLGAGGSFRKLEDRLCAILDSESKIPHVQKIGSLYYNFWRDAKHPRGLWRRATLEEYRRAAPQWETVLDIDRLAAEEGENWVWHGVIVLRPEARLCLVALSRGGSDADVKREFDLSAKKFVEGGFTLPQAKSRIAWRGPDSVFVGTDFGPGTLTDSGYPRIVKEWKRGEPLENARTVFEGRQTDMSVSAYRDLTPGFERDVVFRQVTFFTQEAYLRRENEMVRIAIPEDARASFHREWLLVFLRSQWETGANKYPAGALLAVRVEDFLAGGRDFSVLFGPGERTSLSDFNPTRNKVLLTVLDNVSNRLFVLTPPKADGEWCSQPLPGVLEQMTASLIALDRYESDEYFMYLEGYLNPSTVSLGIAGSGPAEVLKSSPSFFETAGLSVVRHDARSADGTMIPYFQVGPVDLHPDGGAPTILTGYGGFEIAMVPMYNPLVGAGWLERGGVYVVANIRGGGEFGPRWHQSALKENRRKAYEDFAAVAEDLISRKVTSPARLGTKGGSNGGLLVGNMLTGWPHLFGAVVCQVPLLDMKRFHKLLAGASWMAEYGDPDKPEQWEYIRTFSPYHNLKPGAKYPPTLFTTSTKDDRVHPGHARKMVALMKEQCHEVHYYENIEGGHGGAANNRQVAYMFGLAYSFMWDKLGKRGE